mmetsp:Transcript_47197/g.88429  ORF Transcript_47197/g.88429 Transcript_47197/m.88429 type:complete len:99 (+) Transcript_47197:1616-1912(+)
MQAPRLRVEPGIGKRWRKLRRRAAVARAATHAAAEASIPGARRADWAMAVAALPGTSAGERLGGDLRGPACRDPGRPAPAKASMPPKNAQAGAFNKNP